MNRTVHYIVLIIMTCIFTITSAYAEHVFLKNGKIIEGKVVKETPTELTLERRGKTQIYKQKDVMRVLYTDLYMGIQYIRLVDGKVFQAYLVDEDQTTFTFRTQLYSPKEFKVKRTDVLFMARNNPNKLNGTADYTTFDLEWLPPMGEVRQYRIYVKEKYGSYPKKPTAVTNSTKYTVSGIRSDREYKVIVTAVNDKGKESLPSNELDLVTKNYAPQKPPRPRYIIANDSDKKVNVDIAWAHSIDVDGHITAYKIFLKKSGSNKYKLIDTIRIDSTHRKSIEISYRIKGLDDKKDYNLTVSALDNKNLESPMSSPLAFSTENRLPSTPWPVRQKKITAKNGKTYTSILSWRASRDSDGQVVKYMVYNKKKVRAVELGETGTTTFTVKDLDPNEDYNFMVRAVDNRGGVSPFSVLRKLVAPGLNLMARGFYMLPLGNFADIYDAGAGASIYFSVDSLITHGFSLGLDAGYLHLFSSHELIDSSFMIPVQIEAAYKFDITTFFRMGLYASGGFVYTSVTHVEKYMPIYTIPDETVTSFEAVMSAGLICEFVIKKHFVIDLKIGYWGVLESKPMNGMIFSLGAGYRFNVGKK